VLAGIKLTAEPWDVGPGGYQLGHFPIGWSEWNDRFRDSTRSFWLGHPQRLGDFALRLTGSSDLYNRPGKGPYASVNYVTCHDGFTLRDLVSYSRKHNEANSESNGDGHSHNLSKNFGVEGDTEDAYINTRRTRARRNLFASTVIAHGLPMILGGDELSHTQQGNNNAYPQDNEVTWYHWMLSEQQQTFLSFTRHVISLRARYPGLRRPAFVVPEMPVPQASRDVAWRDANGVELSPQDWERDTPRTLQLLISDEAGENAAEQGPALLVLINADERDWEFVIPAPYGSPEGCWVVELDTGAPTGQVERCLIPQRPERVAGETLILARADVFDRLDQSLI
jgi:glycogen operon protein